MKVAFIETAILLDTPLKQNILSFCFCFKTLFSWLFQRKASGLLYLVILLDRNCSYFSVLRRNKLFICSLAYKFHYRIMICFIIKIKNILLFNIIKIMV